MPEMDGYEASREIRRRESAEQAASERTTSGARYPGKNSHRALTANALKAIVTSASRPAWMTISPSRSSLKNCVFASPLFAARRSGGGEDASPCCPQRGLSRGRGDNGAAAPIDLPALRELAGGDGNFERELITTFIDSATPHSGKYWGRSQATIC